MKAIVIGTSTGIGKALVEELHARGHTVGITGRNLDAMLAMQKEMGSSAHIEVLDVRDPETAMAALDRLIQKMGGLDLIFLNAGILPINPGLDWQTERQGTEVNVIGFQAMANVACHFSKSKMAGMWSVFLQLHLYGARPDRHLTMLPKRSFQIIWKVCASVTLEQIFLSRTYGPASLKRP